MAAARLGLHAAGRTPRAAHEQNERRGDRGQAKRRRSSHACHLGHDAEPEANEQNREPGPQQRQPRQARAKVEREQARTDAHRDWHQEAVEAEQVVQRLGPSRH
jgi:hypothetical protein